MKFHNITEHNFFSIFRRHGVVVVHARFYDEEYLKKYLPDASKYGIFPRKASLLSLYRSSVGCAAGDKVHAAWEDGKSIDDIDRIINSYVLEGGDNGDTCRVLREACGLLPRPAREGDRISIESLGLQAQRDVDPQARIPPTPQPPGFATDPAAAVRAFTEHYINEMLARSMDRISVSWFN